MDFFLPPRVIVQAVFSIVLEKLLWCGLFFLGHVMKQSPKRKDRQSLLKFYHFWKRAVVEFLCVDALCSSFCQFVLFLICWNRHRLPSSANCRAEFIPDLWLSQDLLEDAHDVHVLLCGGLHVAVTPVHANEALGCFRQNGAVGNSYVCFVGDNNNGDVFVVSFVQYLLSETCYFLELKT